MRGELLGVIESAITDQYSDDAPGGSMAVIYRGDVIARQSSGLTNLSSNDVWSEDTVSYIASTSKQFTATIILQLAGEGRLDLDAPAVCFLPRLAAVSKNVTIEHLLRNRSGLYDPIDTALIAGLDPSRHDMTREHVEKLIFSQRTLNFDPGTAYRYSNANYVLLAWIAEKICGKKFGQILSERIFVPLGMSNSHVAEMSGDRPQGAARSYVGNGTSGYFEICWNMYEAGDGGIWTTLNDMIRWEQNLVDGTIAPSNTSEQLCQRRTDDKRAEYCRGMVVGSYRQHEWHAHGGGMPGYKSYRLRFPAVDLSIIMMANHVYPDMTQRAFKIADAVLDDCGVAPHMPIVGTATWREQTGRRAAQNSPLIAELISNGDGYAIQICGDKPLRLIATGADVLASEFDGLMIHEATVTRANSGWSLSIGGLEVDGLVDIESPPTAAIEEIGGIFVNDEMGCTLTVSPAADEIRVDTEGPFGGRENRMFSRVSDELFLEQASPLPRMSCRFIRDSLGRIDEVRFSTFRVSNLGFRRVR